MSPAWYWVYACIGVVYVMIFVLTLLSDFPVLKSRGAATAGQTLQIRETWGPGVALLALAALCYILGQLGFISWVPEYATTRFQMDIQQAGGLVSHFWTAYMVGMWVFSALLRFFDLQRIVTVLAALSAAFMYLFIHARSRLVAMVFAGVGFCFQRDLHHHHHAGIAKNPGDIPQTGQFHPDLRHHRHHANVCRDWPYCGPLWRGRRRCKPPICCMSRYSFCACCWDSFDLQGAPWRLVASLNDNLGNAGFVVIGLFAVCWGISVLNYRWRRYDQLPI